MQQIAGAGRPRAGGPDAVRPGSGVDFSGEGRLGEPVRTFDARPARRSALGWTAALALAAAALTPIAVWALVTDRRGLGTAAALLAVAYAGAVGWIVGRDDLRSRIRVAHLHTGGVATDGRGGATEYTWDELESVTVSGVLHGARTRWRFTVAAADGRVLHFGGALPDVRELGEAIAAQITGRTVVRHLMSVQAGESVRFGPFTVDLDGVEKDGERLPWGAVKDVSIDNGLVCVASPGTTLAALAGQMPDALAFTGLCAEVEALREDS